MCAMGQSTVELQIAPEIYGRAQQIASEGNGWKRAGIAER